MTTLTTLATRHPGPTMWSSKPLDPRPCSTRCQTRPHLCSLQRRTAQPLHRRRPTQPRTKGRAFLGFDLSSISERMSSGSYRTSRRFPNRRRVERRIRPPTNPTTPCSMNATPPRQHPRTQPRCVLPRWPSRGGEAAEHGKGEVEGDRRNRVGGSRSARDKATCVATWMERVAR